MNKATDQISASASNPPPPGGCPLKILSLEYDGLAARMLGEEDDPDGDAIFSRMHAISEEASYLTPMTMTSAAFQFMLANAEAGLAFTGADTASQHAASRAKVNRLFYRALDYMLASGQLPNARAYTLRADLDPQAPYVPKAARSTSGGFGRRFSLMRTTSEREGKMGRQPYVRPTAGF
jgi:hypothetical protein